ncbi:hypothetical protein Y032_0166g63 [Ancylostoma ceylanicum]|uniref:Ankyrin repeat domain-containing protein n=1 Tax=Ancylostoma ceylanicum TaxID=53326 RepID=A0A016SWS6_9BILA|nr:hypothetical protein Y032_0166g63 [Ancylostoma ceylanicum]
MSNSFGRSSPDVTAGQCSSAEVTSGPGLEKQYILASAELLEGNFNMLQIRKLLLTQVCFESPEKVISGRGEVWRVSERRWERGDISFVFNAKAKHESDELIIMDNNTKVFQRVRHEESEAEVDEEVDVLMSSDIVSAQMSTKTITFRQAFSGWVFKHAREEQIGDYNVNFYLVEGMKLVSRKRREHLTADDIKKNKSFMQSLASGAAVGDEDFKSLQHRKSLAPPGRMPTTWEEYVGAAPGAAPPLGRAQILKQNEKQFTALIGMSEDFPMGVEVLLDILEIVAPFKHLEKLRRFCEARLPPGFPVRVEIPLLPTISAKVTFQKLQFVSNLSDKLFYVPTSYREDPTRFPDL